MKLYPPRFNMYYRFFLTGRGELDDSIGSRGRSTISMTENGCTYEAASTRATGYLLHAFELDMYKLAEQWGWFSSLAVVGSNPLARVPWRNTQFSCVSQSPTQCGATTASRPQSGESCGAY
jgi:hypothetical protein